MHLNMSNIHLVSNNYTTYIGVHHENGGHPQNGILHSNSFGKQ